MDMDRGSAKIITVIGGGPSGMAAAISAARQGAGMVRLIEKNDILGRKLLATGNGRCNLTNTNCRDAEKTLHFFEGLGLLTRVEDEGRVYPYSEQAAAVQEALVSELEHLGVEIQCGVEVQAIEKAVPAPGYGAAGKGTGYWIITGTKTGTASGTGADRLFSDAVILSTGGKAGPQYGSTGDGYRFAKAFDHNIVSVRPSLVQMVSDDPFFKSLKGVRAKGRAELLRSNQASDHEQTVDREDGEIQFTEDGLSGICIFNLSRGYVRGDHIKIDLFPEYGEESLKDILTGRAEALKERSMAEFFTGMIHKKLIPVILTLLSMGEERKAAELSREEIAAAVRLLKGWRISVTGTKGWKEAQVTAGGIDLAEINPGMGSIIVPNLYFTGELLNVDEKCGGYNLQWAWTSGLAAGKSAAEAIRKK